MSNPDIALQIAKEWFSQNRTYKTVEEAENALAEIIRRKCREWIARELNEETKIANLGPKEVFVLDERTGKRVMIPPHSETGLQSPR